jgi:hypothetical protein
MSCRVRVLYEDQRAAGAEHGPHLFVLACVGDRVGRSLYDLRAEVEVRALKGVDNLVKAIQRPEDYGADGAVLLALIDGDRAWRHLGLDRDADELIRRALPGAEVFVLRRNLETLLERLSAALGEPWDRTTRLGLNDRDKLLLRGAHADRTVRERVCSEVGALGALAARIAEILSPGTAAGSAPDAPA